MNSSPSHPAERSRNAKPLRRIVLTGGLGAGKTVISKLLAARHASRFTVVPEAATQVYDALQTRWDRLDLPGRRDVQRQIYEFQLQQEAALAAAHPDRILLLDRGSIDGAAYWPEGPAAYWHDLGTTHDTEIARYDAVILLETAAALGIYDGDASNPRRHEDSAAAIASGKVLEKLWSTHPCLTRIPAHESIDAKQRAVEQVILSLVFDLESS